ncbi:MAG: hypothetical protein RLP02_22845 [Coleofasciculus sp. C2-GNP5-27]
MANNPNVKIKIEADTKQAEKNLGDLTGATEKTNETLKDSKKQASAATRAFRGLGEAGEVARKGVNVLGGAALAAAGAAAAFAGGIERTTGIVNRMNGDVSQAQRQIGGLVSQLNLITTRNKIAQTGLQLTNQQFADLAEVAAEFAAATGTETTQAMEQLGDAVATLSNEELEHYGISVDTSKTRSEQFAEILRQLHERASQLETGADTAGGAIDRFTVLVVDAKTEADLLAGVLLDDMEPAFSSLFTTINGGNEVLFTWNEAADLAKDIATGLVSAVAAAVETIATMLDDTLHNIMANIDAIGQLIDRISEGNFSLEGLNWNIRQSGDPISLFGEILDRNLRTAVSQPERGGSNRDPSFRAPPDPNETRTSGTRERPKTLDELMGDPLGNEALNELAGEGPLGQSTNEWNDARLQEAAERAAEAQEIIKELQQASAEAAATFEDAWKTGLDAVIESFEEANRVAAKSGNEMLSNARLLEEGMKAVGNQVLTSIGDNFTSAFAEAVAASVTGAKSFGEAMEGMASSILNALLQEAVVQTIAETARAIAAFASQNYGEGALHLAAAGTWAAVGVAAGAGAAAMASSKGNPGSAASGAATSVRDARDEDRDSGPKTININYSNPLYATSEDVTRGLEEALRRAS